MLKAFALAAVLAAATTPAWADAASTAAQASGPGASSTASAPAASAPAAADPAMAKVRQVCAADFVKACPKVKPDTPEATQCVRDNFSNLSEPCQGAIMEMMAARSAG